MARILVIEDDEPVREAVTSMLTLGGHEPLPIAPSPDIFSQILQLGFDLVITDIRMPTVSGWEVAAWMRRQRSGVPVIALSGHVDLIDASGTRTLFSAVIPKPVRARDLLEEVEHALRGRAA
jgi:two-component system, cell cycle response regulator CpdR